MRQLSPPRTGARRIGRPRRILGVGATGPVESDMSVFMMTVARRLVMTSAPNLLRWKSTSCCERRGGGKRPGSAPRFDGLNGYRHARLGTPASGAGHEIARTSDSRLPPALKATSLYMF